MGWDIVKTATHKEYSPYSEDWYYIRAASIARKVYLRQYTGVGGLKKVYGGAGRRGTLRQKYMKASGGLIRHILQQLEEMQVIEKCDAGVVRVVAESRATANRIWTVLLAKLLVNKQLFLIYGLQYLQERLSDNLSISL